MKLNKILLLCIGLAFLASETKSFGQAAPPPYGYSAWSLGSVHAYATTNLYVGSMDANAAVGQTPVLTYLTCKSDLSTSVLSLWWAQATGNASVSNNVTTSIYLATTNGMLI